MYRIEWEKYDNPGVKHQGPNLYKTSDTLGKKIPMTKEEAEALAKRANSHFKEGKHRAIKVRIRKKQDLKPNLSIST